jgi:hypothetical protein
VDPSASLRDLDRQVGEVGEVGSEAAHRGVQTQQLLTRATTGSTVAELWAVILIGAGSIFSLWA